MIGRFLLGKKVAIQGGVACATSARISLIVQYDGSRPSFCQLAMPEVIPEESAGCVVFLGTCD